mgnify:CR=1 FL=1
MARLRKFDLERELSDFDIFMDIESEAIHKYIAKSNIWFNKELEEVDKKLIEAKKGIQDKDLQSKVENYILDEVHMIDLQLRGIVFSSGVVNVFSFFEFKLKELCDIFSKSPRVNIRTKDLSGNSDFEKGIKFLRKVIEIDSSILDDNSRRLRAFKTIRNRIVHHNLYLDENSQKQIKSNFSEYIDERNLILLQNKIIIPNDKLASEYLKLGTKFLSAVTKNYLDKKI